MGNVESGGVCRVSGVICRVYGGVYKLSGGVYIISGIMLRDNVNPGALY